MVTVEYASEIRKDPRIWKNLQKVYTILIMTGDGRDVWINEGSCGEMNADKESFKIDAKYLKMVSRRHIPRGLPIIHQDEVAWANQFPTCVCGEHENYGWENY